MTPVSVIIPTYNYDKYITTAIESILNQNYQGPIEIVVVDDGSTDNTKQVLDPYISSGKIQYYFQENKGKANATKNAIAKSTGDYIFNLDADDYFFQGKITEYIKAFEIDEQIVHVGSPAKFVHQEKGTEEIENLPKDILTKPIEGKWLLHRFYKYNILFGGGSTYAAKASVLKSITIPDDVDMYIDEFLILAVLPFGKSFFLDVPQSVWRIHGLNYSGNSASEEKQRQKQERLLKSSSAVLAYLNENKFDARLLKIYRLKDATRIISFKESIGKKKLRDMIKYGIEILLTVQPGMRLIKNYYVINRFVPSFLYTAIKRLR